MTTFDADAMLRLYAELQGAELESPAALAQALSLAWRASLEVDEGRLARFVLVMGEGTAPREGAKWFSPPVAVTEDPRRLARLSFATDPWRVALHVSATEGGGLAVTALAAVPELASWPDSAARLVGIEVSAPGRVALLGRSGGVLFERGKMSVHSREDAASLAVSRPAIEALVSHGAEPVAAGHRLRFDRYSEALDAEAWHAHCDDVRQLALRIARDVLHDGVRHVAVAMRQRGHGGAVLFLPGGLAMEHPEVRSLVAGQAHCFRVDSPMSTSGWNAEMLSAFTWRLHVALATELHVAVLRSDALSFLHGRDARTPIVQWLTANGRSRVTQVEAAWRAQVERVADLCQLDGAVVASQLHEPLAMGAFLKVGSDDGRGLDEGARRGTRHHSMRHVVDELEGATGLVVSHDGDVTLYRHREPPASLPLL